MKKELIYKTNISSCSTLITPEIKDMIDNEGYVLESEDLRYRKCPKYHDFQFNFHFPTKNWAKFRYLCSYQGITLVNHELGFMEFVGLRVECHCSDDDFMLKTLEYGENFFFQPDPEDK